ncbi:MAG: glutamate 5-kinase [Kordiimonadales bacterium]|nr:MAG: glutamate 5-kinase [Kordiimonadales bacterium]
MSAALQTSVITDAKRLVIKIGSSLLVNAEGSLRSDWLEGLADDIAALNGAGTQVVLVSSGAIALGREALGYTGRPSRLEGAQAAASVGQIRLAQAYQSVFEKHGSVVAQILLTLGDMEDRPRYLNARNTLDELLQRGAIPVINENDTVATSEIRFGDNDRLAARVAQMVSADTLILLSDIDGLYSADPRTNTDAELITSVETITADIEAMAGKAASSGIGSGGMITKIEAAKIALAGGCSMAIVNGTHTNPINRTIAGASFTLFKASTSPLAVRKSWIRGLMAPQGALHIDGGAVAALERDASLLPAGVVKTDGNFKRGDLVSLLNPAGAIFGQGIVSYSFADTAKLQGKNMRDARALLGYSGRSALVHRDDLVLF